MKKEEAISIIAARGGSKRFPKKNIQLLDGKPLIFYAIDAAKKSKFVKEVIVNTDDTQIADIAKTLGAKVPYLRPKKLANDTIQADMAVAEMVERLDLYKKYEAVVINPPTSPFIKPKHIDDCLTLLFNNSEFDSVTTLSRLDNRHHSLNLGIKKSSNEWKFIFGQERDNFKSRQSKPENYKFCNLFAIRSKQILKGDRFGKKLGFIELPSFFSHDIDSEFDLFLAEQILSKYKENIFN